jgi:hypothetical protein
MQSTRAMKWPACADRPVSIAHVPEFITKAVKRTVREEHIYKRNFIRLYDSG